MICPNCRHPVEDGSTFCPHCDYNFPVASAFADSSKQYQKKEKKKIHPALCTILCFAAVVFIITPIKKGFQDGYNEASEQVAVTAETTRILSPYAITTTAPVTTTLTTTTNMDEYVESCEIVEYGELARNTSNYVEHDIAYFAKVLQIIPPESGNQYYMRLAVSSTFSIDYNDVVIGTFWSTEELGIIEGDLIGIFGKCKGKESYESVLGEKITLPLIEIWYMGEADSSLFVQIDEVGNQTFVFDGLEIKLSSEYAFTTIDNQFSEYYGKPVIVIPATITNISNETKYLYSGDVKLFGTAGTSLDSVHRLIDGGGDLFNDLRKGATAKGNFYLLYDGDGDYYLEFRDYDFTLEIKYPVKK